MLRIRDDPARRPRRDAVHREDVADLGGRVRRCGEGIAEGRAATQNERPRKASIDAGQALANIVGGALRKEMCAVAGARSAPAVKAHKPGIEGSVRGG